VADNFSRRTFEYFDLAHANRTNKTWFEKNKGLYLEHVRAPFANLVERLGARLGPELPRINFVPRKIVRPVYSKHRPQPDGAVVRPQTRAYFAEKQSSRFEWNPGIYLEFGDPQAAGLAGLGLYELNSRQRSRLRSALVEDAETIERILGSRKLKKAWGGLAGERYRRFPRGMDENGPGAALLWQKEFYLSRTLSRGEIIKKDFIPNIVDDFEVAAPFLSWLRGAVGTYSWDGLPRRGLGGTRFREDRI
jgi:uncharacterized protein (TIGR02453 family)